MDLLYESDQKLGDMEEDMCDILDNDAFHSPSSMVSTLQLFKSPYGILNTYICVGKNTLIFVAYKHTEFYHMQLIHANGYNHL
jgi:hypothetical protein